MCQSLLRTYLNFFPFRYIGWYYEKCFEESQRYKEGHYILERNLLIEISWNSIFLLLTVLLPAPSCYSTITITTNTTTTKTITGTAIIYNLACANRQYIQCKVLFWILNDFLFKRITCTKKITPIIHFYIIIIFK